MFNSYSWFLFASKVNSSFDVHVTSWNVEFDVGEGETTTNINFNVDRIFPGMEDFSQTLTAHNKGELKATLSYKIKSFTILGEEYKVNENTTEEDLFYMLQNNYPFKVNIEVSDSDLETGTGNGSLTISLNWPFESDNDELDTYWGERAYSFYEQHPGQDCFSIYLEITATQNNG